MKRNGLLLFLLISSLHLFSQKLLFHKSRKREAIYRTGDKISFRLKNEKRRLTGQIVGFEDSLIVFYNMRINPNNISHFYVDGKTKAWYFFKYRYAKLFFFSGAGYLAIDALNNGVPENGTVIMCASLMGAGLLAQAIVGQKVKVGRRGRVVIIQ
jgi:hypothetical protein